jgi:hypothetical protein
MTKYDFSRCSPEALNKFFAEYEAAKVTQYGWKEYHALKEQARVKTRAEYDREIASIVRDNTPEGYLTINYWDWETFIDLVNASKNAPEE